MILIRRVIICLGLCFIYLFLVNYSRFIWGSVMRNIGRPSLRQIYYLSTYLFRLQHFWIRDGYTLLKMKICTYPSYQKKKLEF